MGDSVVDAVFAAHFARRRGADALQDEELDDDDLDELIGSCVAEECAAAYASHAFELKVGEAAATEGKYSPRTWLMYALWLLPVVKKVYKAIKAEADSVQEDASGHDDVHNPPDLKAR